MGGPKFRLHFFAVGISISLASLTIPRPLLGPAGALAHIRLCHLMESPDPYIHKATEYRHRHSTWWPDKNAAPTTPCLCEAGRLLGRGPSYQIPYHHATAG